MFAGCDDIIRQHKAACLRVTSLLACKDLLWIGTSAGVLLTMPLPHIISTTSKLNNVPMVMGVPHGHTGHVRFLTHIEWQTAPTENIQHQRHSYKGKPEQRSSTKFLVISGGDGYEDFRSSNLSEVAGREDSTNHLLLWNIWLCNLTVLQLKCLKLIFFECDIPEPLSARDKCIFFVKCVIVLLGLCTFALLYLWWHYPYFTVA